MFQFITKPFAVVGKTLAGLVGLVGGALGALHWSDLAGKVGDVMAEKGVERAVKHLTPPREEVMRELIQLSALGDEGQAITQILDEANRRGWVTAYGKRYTEHQIITLLGEVHPDHRQAVYFFLGDLARRDRERFFLFLEILKNDPARQWLNTTLAALRADVWPRTREALVAANRALSGAIEPYADALRNGNREIRTRIDTRRRARAARRASPISRLGRGITNVLGRIF